MILLLTLNDFFQYLNQLDTGLLLRINGLHCNFLDFIMYWLSSRTIWIPFYLLLLYLLYRQHGQTTWMIMLGVAVMILFSDQLSVHLFKNQFQRLRPCHEPALEGLLHLVKGKCGGTYGFVSSHASNTFSVAVFLFGFFRRQIPWLAVGLIAWAAAISYSRIYLGVHYPGDVICGMIFGSMTGWAFRILTNYYISIRKPAQ